MQQFKTQYNYEEFPDAGEIIKGRSMTIPDQTLSVKELMERYARGLSLSGVKVPIYEGDEEGMPDLEHLDLADRQLLLETAQQEIEDIRNRANEKALKLKKRKNDEAVQKAYQRLIKEGKIEVKGDEKGGGDETA